MNRLVKSTLLFAILSASITACGEKKQDDNKDKEPEQKDTYEVDAATWNELFFLGKVYNPFDNMTITSTNGGKLLYGNTGINDVTIKIDNGKVYIGGFEDIYMSFPQDGYDQSTNKYTAKMYQNEESWIYVGAGVGYIYDLLGGYATVCLSSNLLKYQDFTFKDNYYECETLKSTSPVLPVGNEYILKNIKIQILNKKVQSIDYLIQNYNIQITSTFTYGKTTVEVPDLPAE